MRKMWVRRSPLKNHSLRWRHVQNRYDLNPSQLLSQKHATHAGSGVETEERGDLCDGSKRDS